MEGVVPSVVMSSATRFLAVRLFPWVVVLMGAGAIALGVQDVRTARDSLTWPAVDGRVMQTSIQTERSSRDSATAGSVTYRPIVRYAYRVDGVAYEGQQISIGEYATADQADARRVVEQYPTGSAVRVYYRPGQPGEAVLEPGSHGVPWFFLVLGAVFLVVGLLFVVLFPRLMPAGRGPAPS